MMSRILEEKEDVTHTGWDGRRGDGSQLEGESGCECRG